MAADDMTETPNPRSRTAAETDEHHQPSGMGGAGDDVSSGRTEACGPRSRSHFDSSKQSCTPRHGYRITHTGAVAMRCDTMRCRRPGFQLSLRGCQAARSPTGADVGRRSDPFDHSSDVGLSFCPTSGGPPNPATRMSGDADAAAAAALRRPSGWPCPVVPCPASLCSALPCTGREIATTVDR
jgi:hypothetical protein